MIQTGRLHIIGAILVAGSASLSAGCFSTLSEERNGSPTIRSTPFLERSIGTARMTVTPHDDGLGWRISAERMIAREMLTETSQHWVGRRYLFSPLSVFAGIIQCPIGLLSTLGPHPNKTDRQYGCARLVMMEPLDGEIPLPPTELSEIHRTEAWEPLRNGIVQLNWQNRSGEPSTYALDQTGRVDIRLVHLLANTNPEAPLTVTDSPLPLRIRLRDENGASEDREIPVFQTQLRQARSHLPKPIALDKWPSSPIMYVRVDSPDAAAHAIGDRLRAWLIQQGFCTVAGDPLQFSIIDEQQVQHANSSNDAPAVRPGRLLAPNILLRATVSTHPEALNETRSITVQLINQQEGSVVPTSHGMASTQALDNAIKHTLSDLAVITARAPRHGCPTPGTLLLN